MGWELSVKLEMEFWAESDEVLELQCSYGMSQQ